MTDKISVSPDNKFKGANKNQSPFELLAQAKNSDKAENVQIGGTFNSQGSSLSRRMEKATSKDGKNEKKNKLKGQKISKAKKTANSIKKNKDTPKQSGDPKVASENKSSKLGAQDKKCEMNILQMIKTMKPKPKTTPKKDEKESQNAMVVEKSSVVVKEEFIVKPFDEKSTKGSQEKVQENVEVNENKAALPMQDIQNSSGLND